MQELHFRLQLNDPKPNRHNYRTPSSKDDTSTVSNGEDISTRITAATLPRDILSLILYEALHQHDAGIEDFNSAVPSISYLSSASPIPLAQVCSHWRDVAINSSQLWSEICIDHPRESHIWLTKLWLERARTHPLRLVVKTSTYLTVNPSYFSQILQLFISKISQWKAIDFDIPPETIQEFAPVLFSKKSQLGQLESASICAHTRMNRIFRIKDVDQTSGATQPIDIVWESIHSSPCLKFVNWNNLYEGLSPPAHVPWSQLTRLDLDYFVGGAEILRILALSPNMKTFRAQGAPKLTSDPGSIHYAAPLVHDLNTLCLTAAEDVGYLFVNIKLPDLRKLHITYQNLTHTSSDLKREGSSWNLANKFMHFLSQSRCDLDDVWLNKPPYSDTDLRSHLASSAFQSIRRLRLSGANLVTDNVIQALTLKQGGVGILSSVKSLWLDIEGTEITDGLISTMVASRWLLSMPVTQLEEVRLTRDFLEPFGSVDIKRLSSMLAEGLRIIISPGTLGGV